MRSEMDMRIVAGEYSVIADNLEPVSHGNESHTLETCEGLEIMRNDPEKLLNIDRENCQSSFIKMVT